eukprot:Stramenopile-MAST_4_protein_286
MLSGVVDTWYRIGRHAARVLGAGAGANLRHNVQRHRPSMRTAAFGSGKPDSELDYTASVQMKALHDAMKGKGKFEELGIGGMDDILNNLFQRTFASRMLPPSAIDRLNLQHTKGILLHGPPGTGKTLVARQIGAMLGARTPTHINGPEIFSSLVGESEEKIRNIFKASQREWRMQGNKSPLHVLIFDEIDAVCKRRDASTASGRSRVHDNVVNQLLTQIDGLNRQNNLLVIGVTNRRDLLDEALLRPGRLEVHLEVGLPNEEGRLQILNVHTRDLYSQNMMANDVDLGAVARSTMGFTGAEIEGLARSTVAYALGDQQQSLAQITNKEENAGEVDRTSEEDDFEMFLKHQEQTKVSMAHFQKAIENVERPAALGGSNGALVEPSNPFGMAIKRTSSAYTASMGVLIQIAEIARSRKPEKDLDTGTFEMAHASMTHSILLTGRPGVGRTTVLAKFAKESQFEFVRVVNGRSLVGKSPDMVIEFLMEAFMDAYRSPFSLLVLDDLELLVQLGDDRLLPTLQSFLRSHPPTKCQLVVAGVLDCDCDELHNNFVLKSFQGALKIPCLEIDEVHSYLQTANMFSNEDDLWKATYMFPKNITFRDIGNIVAAVKSASSSRNSLFQALEQYVQIYCRQEKTQDEVIFEAKGEQRSPVSNDRYKGPLVDTMAPEQKALYDEIARTRTTGIRGPFGPWLANIAIAGPAQELGRVCRYETSLSLIESELVILTTAKHYNSETEWTIHVEEARKAGLPERIIAAIANRKVPVFDKHERKLQALYEFTLQMLRTNKVSTKTYANLKEACHGSDAAIVETVSIAGYYGFVAHTLNVFEIDP